VFNRFWRADPARTRTTGGTGLGLAIALEDTHLHGGWLQAWGRPGLGSQFRLTLPRRLGHTVERSPLAMVPTDATAHAPGWGPPARPTDDLVRLRRSGAGVPNE
jgi:two-component system sensor histidine kinase MtrB